MMFFIIVIHNSCLRSWISQIFLNQSVMKCDCCGGGYFLCGHVSSYPDRGGFRWRQPSRLWRRGYRPASPNTGLSQACTVTVLACRRDSASDSDRDSLWSIAFYLEQSSPAGHLLPADTMPHANGAPNPPIFQAPMPAPGPCASNRSECWTITDRPNVPTPSADAWPATGAAR